MSTKLRKQDNTFITVEEILAGGGGIAYGEGGGTENYLQVPDAEGNLVDSGLQQFGGGSIWDALDPSEVGFSKEDGGTRYFHYLGNGIGNIYYDFDKTQETGTHNWLYITVGDFEFGKYSSINLCGTDDPLSPSQIDFFIDNSSPFVVTADETNINTPKFYLNFDAYDNGDASYIMVNQLTGELDLWAGANSDFTEIYLVETEMFFNAYGSGSLIEFWTDGDIRFNLDGAGNFSLLGLPTSAAGLSAGDVWNNAGTLKIV